MGLFKKNKIKNEIRKEIVNKNFNIAIDVQPDEFYQKIVNKKSSVKTNTKTGSKSKITENTVVKKQPTNVYYLTSRFENNKRVGWEIKRGNATKVSAFVATKEEAKIKVKALAKNSNASVIIYRQDGTIEETYKINSESKSSSKK